MEWNEDMNFEEIGSFIYIYRLDRDISWVRTKLINNACVTRLFVQISTSTCHDEEGHGHNAAEHPATAPNAWYITFSLVGYHTIVALVDCRLAPPPHLRAAC